MPTPFADEPDVGKIPEDVIAFVATLGSFGQSVTVETELEVTMTALPPPATIVVVTD